MCLFFLLFFWKKMILWLFGCRTKWWEMKRKKGILNLDEWMEMGFRQRDYNCSEGKQLWGFLKWDFVVYENLICMKLWRLKIWFFSVLKKRSLFFFILTVKFSVRVCLPAFSSNCFALVAPVSGSFWCFSLWEMLWGYCPLIKAGLNYHNYVFVY